MNAEIIHSWTHERWLDYDIVELRPTGPFKQQSGCALHGKSFVMGVPRNGQ